MDLLQINLHSALWDFTQYTYILIYKAALKYVNLSKWYPRLKCSTPYLSYMLITCTFPPPPHTHISSPGSHLSRPFLIMTTVLSPSINCYYLCWRGEAVKERGTGESIFPRHMSEDILRISEYKCLRVSSWR